MNMPEYIFNAVCHVDINEISVRQDCQHMEGKMTRNEIETIVDEIEAAVCDDENAVGFVKGDGSWEQ